MTRADVGTLTAHLAALRAHAPAALAMYVAAGHREVDLALARRALAPETATTMHTVLEDALRGAGEAVP
jgi:predicted GNAT family acetyltransferase